MLLYVLNIINFIMSMLLCIYFVVSDKYNEFMRRLFYVYCMFTILLLGVDVFILCSHLD